MASYFLTNTLKAYTGTSANTGTSTYTGTSAKIVAGKITKEVVDFKTTTRQVIAYLEGGYYHPDMLKDGRVKDSRYRGSGETMFGIDRKTGIEQSTSPAGVKFWKKIDEIQAKTKWKWLYIPPDPLQTELIDLVIQMQEKPFNRNFEKWVPDPKLRAIIKSDGRLLFNFVYAIWNGEGWFQGFGREISEAYKKGMTSSEDLLKLFVYRRINNVGVLHNRYYPKGNAQNSLINQGGNQIKKLVGIQ